MAIAQVYNESKISGTNKLSRRTATIQAGEQNITGLARVLIIELND